MESNPKTELAEDMEEIEERTELARCKESHALP